MQTGNYVISIYEDEQMDGLKRAILKNSNRIFDNINTNAGRIARVKEQVVNVTNPVGEMYKLYSTQPGIKISKLNPFKKVDL